MAKKPAPATKQKTKSKRRPVVGGNGHVAPAAKSDEWVPFDIVGGSTTAPDPDADDMAWLDGPLSDEERLRLAHDYVRECIYLIETMRDWATRTDCGHDESSPFVCEAIRGLHWTHWNAFVKVFQPVETLLSEFTLTQGVTAEVNGIRGASFHCCVSQVASTFLRWLSDMTFRMGTVPGDVGRLDAEQVDAIAGYLRLVTFRQSVYAMLAKERDFALRRLRDAAPPRDDATPIKDEHKAVLEFAKAKLKGIQRRVLELTVEHGGEVPIQTLAADPAMTKWDNPGNAFNSVKQAINRKLKPVYSFKLIRQNNASVLHAIPTKRRS